MNKHREKVFFTLIELLVVISIIAMLAALLLPSLRMARERGKSIACQGNLKQMGVAIMGYTNDYNAWMPLAEEGGWVQLPYYRQTWIGKIHEYVDSKAFTKTYVSKIFLCPSGSDETYTANGNGGNYMYNCRLGSFRATYGYPAIYECGPRRLGKATSPAECGVMIDGCNKTKGDHMFDFYAREYALGYMDSRHNQGTNVLFADFHTSWKNPFLMSTADTSVLSRFVGNGVEGYYWPR